VSAGTGPTTRPTPATTPGVAGYFLAVFISIGVTALAIAVMSIPEDGFGALAVLVVGAVYVTIFAIPSAPIGVLLVHLACRRVEAQSVHVLAAGVAGIFTGAGYGLLVDFGEGVLVTWPLTLTLGLATAIGRAAVIPLVPAVRARRRPVDDDFAPERSAC
jgi:hypothetical protein